ncbi:hypothetical protein POM88_024139 [Heracleum sosnowskyi]|uniref:DUF6598 domain-containing protein n=1 Tax=Heracleum sosnowskyi TaxID=360622 RepID=A0AAD8I4J3_9APIA|nr:hypothetical protein POM88_024139 [Heracleum sosnowskyi]
MGFDNFIGEDLYYQNEVDMSKPSIKFGDTIFVKNTEPKCSFKEREEFDIQFDLFCGAYKGSINVAFEPFGDQVWFEERTIRSVDGSGQIRVVLGFLSNATVANLEIQLLNISAISSVHGIVAARNSKLDLPACTSVLFWKSPANKIEVGRDGVIPLSKSRVGVPLDSELYVDMSLNIDGDHYTDTASFDPLTTGGQFVQVGNPKKKAKICVKVTSDPRVSSIYSTYGYLRREWDGDHDDYDDSEEDTEE